MKVTIQEESQSNQRRIKYYLLHVLVVYPHIFLQKIYFPIFRNEN